LFCGATGNCAFWVFRYQNGRYEKILDTDMVQHFGFVHSSTNGLPDLVTWSHGSAFDSGRGFVEIRRRLLPRDLHLASDKPQGE
jgi:hypothetical protein